MAPCDKSVVETGTGSLEAGGGSGEPPEAWIPEANDLPGCVHGEAVQGEGRDHGSSMSGHGCGAYVCL